MTRTWPQGFELIRGRADGNKLASPDAVKMSGDRLRLTVVSKTLETTHSLRVTPAIRQILAC